MASPSPPRALWTGWALPVGVMGFVWAPPADGCPSLYPQHLQGPCGPDWVEFKSSQQEDQQEAPNPSSSLPSWGNLGGWVIL